MKLTQLCFNGGQDAHYPIYWEGKRAGKIHLKSEFHDNVREALEKKHKELAHKVASIPTINDHCVALDFSTRDFTSASIVEVTATGEPYGAEVCSNLVDMNLETKYCT